MKVAYRFYYPWWFKSFRIFSVKKFSKLPILKLQILGNEFCFYSKDIIVQKLTHHYRNTKPCGYAIDITNLHKTTTQCS